MGADRTDPPRPPRTGWFVVGAVALALALRAPFVAAPLESDEAGLLLVARNLDPGGEQLYGYYWVDRPPLLVGYYWLADQALGEAGVRAVGLVVAAALVVSAVWSGRLVGGPAAASWAGLVAACLASSYTIGAHMMNGMLQAAALEMLSCTCTIAAVHPASRSGPRYAWAFAAGLAGGCAVLVKQNFVGGLAFAGAVLVTVLATRAAPVSVVARLFCAGLAGFVVPVVAIVAWADQAGVGLEELWFAMYDFRTAALEVIGSSSLRAPLTRVVTLTAAALGSGVVLLLWAFVRSIPELRRDPAVLPVAVGTVALVGVAVVSLALGGSWWRHYVVQLVPSCALVAALVGGRPSRDGRFVRGVAVLAAVATVLAAGVGVVTRLVIPTDEIRVGRWVGASSRASDTAMVAWGHPEILLAAGTRSPYPYLWSLPTRTRDPGLRLLRATLRGPAAPTWVVEWDSFDSWNLDRGGRLSELVTDRYRKVAAPCGRDVYLLRDISRPLQPMDAC